MNKYAFLCMIVAAFFLMIVGCDDDEVTGPINLKPVAKFNYTTPVNVCTNVIFDASGSYDPDGHIINYYWEFGDGMKSNAVSVTREFTSPRYINVLLKVTDDAGDYDNASTTINIEWAGTTCDCEFTNGHNKFLGYRWPQTNGETAVAMYLSSAFANFDPGWQDVAHNSAVSAMGEWHWHSDANIRFGYYSTIVSNLSEGKDGKNSICVSYIDGPGEILGQAHYWYNPNSGLFTECDVIIDKSEIWGVKGEKSKLDLISVICHEFGHLWGLADLDRIEAKWETLYKYSKIGETHKRTLYCGDKNGIQSLYGYKVRSASANVSAETQEPPIPVISVSSKD